MRAISTEIAAVEPILIVRSRIIPVFLPSRAKFVANEKRKPALGSLAKPFCALENAAMLLLMAAAAVGIGMGFLDTQGPAKSVASQREAAPLVLVSAYNPGPAH